MGLHILFYNIYLGSLSKTPFCTSIAALSAYLKLHGHKTSLITVTRKGQMQKAARRAAEFKPDVVAFSVSTSEWPNVRRMIKDVKAHLPRTPIVCGGYHVTLRPDEVFSLKEVDAVCLGEGEEPFLKYVERLKNGRTKKDIENFWIKEKGFFRTREYKNPIRFLAEDLNALPYWDREIFMRDMAMKVEDFCALGGMPVGAGRGCPFRCTFCNNSTYLRIFNKIGKYVRKRTPENVIEEMKVLRTTYGVRKFELWDELFGFDKKWVSIFCELYKREVGIPYAVLLRIDQTDDQLLEMLYESGMRLAMFGVEVGNEEFRGKVLKKRFKNKDIEHVFSKCHELGIDTLAFFMYGLPGETPELIEETLAFARKIRPTYFACQLFYPLIGTELYDRAIQQGLLTEESLPCQTGAGLQRAGFLQPVPGVDYFVPILKNPALPKELLQQYGQRIGKLAEELEARARKHF